MEVPPSGAFVATADLECAFYHMKLPCGMEEYFSLPAIDSTFLMEAGVTDLPYGPGVMLSARVVVLLPEVVVVEMVTAVVIVLVVLVV